MKLLDRYIIKKFIVHVIFIFGIMALITSVIDFAEKIDNFLSRDIPLIAVLEYYGSFIPFILNMISPMMIFIGALYFTSRMAYNTEIVAMMSGGTSFTRFLRPYIVVALGILLLDIFLKGWGVPTVSNKMANFEYEYFDKKVKNLPENIHRQVAPNVFYYVGKYQFADTVGHKVSLEKFVDDKLVYKLRGSRVTWDNRRELWIAHRYTERIIDGIKETVRTGDTLSLDIGLKPDNFGRKDEINWALTNTQLLDIIKQERARGSDQVDFYLVELHQRISMPFTTLILIVIAVCVSSRKIRGGTGTHLMFGLLIAFGFVLIMRFTTTFAQYSDFNPILAVWFPNIFYTLIALWLVRRTSSY